LRTIEHPDAAALSQLKDLTDSTIAAIGSGVDLSH
jgi:hypothetical protein